MLKDSVGIKTGLVLLEEWAKRSFKKFSKAEANLCIEERLFCNDTGCGLTDWGAALQKRPWGPWWAVRWMWASSALAAKRDNSLLDSISRRRASTLREDINSLYSALFRPQLGHRFQFWVPQYKTDIGKPEEVQHGATMMAGSWSTQPVRRHWGRQTCSA